MSASRTFFQSVSISFVSGRRTSTESESRVLNLNLLLSVWWTTVSKLKPTYVFNLLHPLLDTRPQSPPPHRSRSFTVLVPVSFDVPGFLPPGLHVKAVSQPFSFMMFRILVFLSDSVILLGRTVVVIHIQSCFCFCRWTFVILWTSRCCGVHSYHKVRLCPAVLVILKLRRCVDLHLLSPGC